MPLIGQNDLEQHNSPVGFVFGATRLQNLGASEYTLVVIAVDQSSSVSRFNKDLDRMLGVATGSCRRSPRADNLMVRVIKFGDGVDEFHGFKLLGDISANDYNDCVRPNGMTALNDALLNGIASLNQYGKHLVGGDFTANAILIAITDGGENHSKASVQMVHEALAQVRRDEALESIRTILVGVNTKQAGIAQILDQYRQEVGFDQFVDIEDAEEKSFAKLAEFMSSSITSQSQSLGTGGPSQPISFSF